MKLEDFNIGELFFAQAGFMWKCTDKGTRTITAIRIENNKKLDWYFGPPYMVEEVVFDENDMLICVKKIEGLTLKTVQETRINPGFDNEDIFKMLGEMNRDYKNKNMLKYDRVGENGEIFHPYTGIKKNNQWYILVLEMFSKEYSEILEDDFMTLAIAQDEDFIARKKDMDNS